MNRTTQVLITDGLSSKGATRKKKVVPNLSLILARDVHDVWER